MLPVISACPRLCLRFCLSESLSSSLLLPVSVCLCPCVRLSLFVSVVVIVCLRLHLSQSPRLRSTVGFRVDRGWIQARFFSLCCSTAVHWAVLSIWKVGPPPVRWPGGDPTRPAGDPNRLLLRHWYLTWRADLAWIASRSPASAFQVGNPCYSLVVFRKVTNSAFGGFLSRFGRWGVGFEGPWLSKSSDFVKYILQKSTFCSICARIASQLPLATLCLLLAVDLGAAGGSPGGVIWRERRANICSADGMRVPPVPDGLPSSLGGSFLTFLEPS